MKDTCWDEITRRFKKNPELAFVFAQTLNVLQDDIRSNPKRALKTLDKAVKKLFPYTPYRKSPYKTYVRSLEGKLLPKDDPIFIKEFNATS